jgi:hypothetical protein
MKPNIALVAAVCVLASAAEAQVTYCKDIGGNKTYCTGGTVIHRGDGATIIQNHAPAQAQAAPTLPNPLLQDNALPTMNAPYTAAGTQKPLPVAPSVPTLPAALPAQQASPVIVVPPAGGGRICHQFGNTLVCN